MVLVCHEANGHFDKDGLQPGSPQWHTWSLHWRHIVVVATKRLSRGKGERDQQPLLHALRGEVLHTLSPVKPGTGWEVQFYSGLAGYEMEMCDLVEAC